MKFINYLTSITGVDIFPLISLILFFSVFMYVCITNFFFTSKKYIDEMKNLPLEEDNKELEEEHKHKEEGNKKDNTTTESNSLK